MTLVVARHGLVEEREARRARGRLVVGLCAVTAVAARPASAGILATQRGGRRPGFSPFQWPHKGGEGAAAFPGSNGRAVLHGRRTWSMSAHSWWAPLDGGVCASMVSTAGFSRVALECAQRLWPVGAVEVIRRGG